MGNPTYNWQEIVPDELWDSDLGFHVIRDDGWHAVQFDVPDDEDENDLGTFATAAEAVAECESVPLKG